MHALPLSSPPSQHLRSRPDYRPVPQRAMPSLSAVMERYTFNTKVATQSVYTSLSPILNSILSRPLPLYTSHPAQSPSTFFSSSYFSTPLISLLKMLLVSNFTTWESLFSYAIILCNCMRMNTALSTISFVYPLCSLTSMQYTYNTHSIH